MTQQEVIKTFNQSLNNTQLSGRAALDEAVKASSNFTSYQEVANKFIEDQKAETNWHKFLVEKCGIILDNSDTGAISGADAGSGTVKTATTIIPCEGDADYPSGSSFTVDGLTIYGIPAKNRLTAAQQYVVQGLYSWWIRDALALINESYGYSYTDANTTNSRLKLKFINATEGDEADMLAYVSYDGSDGKEWESRVLCVNMAHFNKIDTSDRHGTVEDGLQLDRTLVHELVHGLMASNVNYFYDLPTFLAEGGTAELIHGIDDERRYNIIAYAKNPEVFEKILRSTFTESAIEVYAGGYIFMRYFAKQASDTTFYYDTYYENVAVDDTNFATNYWDSVNMTGSNDADTLTNSGADVYISAGNGSDVVKNYGAEVSIDGGAGSDKLINQGAQGSIDGGAGDDTIENSGEKSTVLGSAGIDVINNTGEKSSVSGGEGDDIIVNSVSDYETIDVVSYTITQSGIMSGIDSVVLIADGNSTLKAYSADLLGGNNSTLLGGDGDDSIENYAGKARLYGDAGSDFIANYGIQSTVYGGDDDDVILNGAASVAVDVSELVDSSAENTVMVEGFKSRLYGGNGNDSINNESDEVNIYGQNGNDSVSNTGTSVSVNGGNGNDLVSNEGKAAYILLGDGEDEIYNYADSVVASGDDGNDFLINEGELSTVFGGDGNDEILNYGDHNMLLGGAGKDTIYSSGEAVSIDGGGSSDYIYNEGVKAFILGGTGNDTLYNEGDHITLSGGAGNDSIVNNGGKHIVYAFGTGDGKDIVSGANDNDSILIVEGSYTTQVSGNNLIVRIGSDRMTLRNAAKKKIVFIASDSDASDEDSAQVSFDDDAAAAVTLDSGIEIGDASARTAAIKINGNTDDNSIVGGAGKDTIYGKAGNDYLAGGDGADKLYGNGGDDTLWGGAGNDTLWGNAGADTFIYNAGEGRDVISGFGDDDLLQITGDFTTSYSAAKNTVSFKFDSGALTLKDFTATTFNVNGDAYAISGKQLVKK